MKHDTLRRQLPEFALATLPAEDALKVHEHLPFCTVCRMEMRRYAQSSLILALRTPPPRLPDGTLSRITGNVLGDVEQAAAPAKPVSTGRAWRNFAIALGVLVVVLAGVATAAGVGWYRNTHESSGGGGGGGGSNGAPSGPARVYEIKGTGEPGATGRIYLAPGNTSGVIDIDGLPVLSSQDQKLYVIWAEEKGGVIKQIRAFNSTRDKQVTLPLLAHIPAQVDRFFVTAEAFPAIPQKPAGTELVTAAPD